MRRQPRLLLLALALMGCIDKLLEEEPPPDARLVVTIEPGTVSIPRGGEYQLIASVRRVGAYTGAVALTVDGVPPGVSAELGIPTTTGAVTSIPVTVHVAPGTNLGQYLIAVRGRAEPLPIAAAQLVLSITEPPGYSLSLSRTAFTIIRGGIAPAQLTLARTNLSEPVAISLQGPPGISATIDPDPVIADHAVVTLAVGAQAPVGTHNLTLRGTAAGLPNQDVALTVTVSSDPLQLIAPAELSAPQAGSASAELIVNRGGFTGDVALVLEGLPGGVTPSFTPQPAAGAHTTLTLSVAPETPPGSYLLTLRGDAGGGRTAAAALLLQVREARIALTLTPTGLSLFPGTSTQASVSITRTDFAGSIALSAEGLPAGLTVVPLPATTTSATARLSVTASGDAPPGDYPITIRATPQGLSPGAERTTLLTIHVLEAPPGGGNVLLDWSRCSPPDWVAGQDGSGEWIRLQPAGGVFRFGVSSGTGGFAYAQPGATVVRYLTQEELTAGPIDLCPPAPGPKTLTGTGVHTFAGEIFSYSLGGGLGTSRGNAPGFSIAGVQEGAHDLVAWGNVLGGGVGLRGLLRRDVDLPTGASLGAVDLSGQESFPPLATNFTVTGSILGGQQINHTMSYLTTEACTINPLYTSNPGVFTQFGVPVPIQRPNDYHLLTVNVTGTGSFQSTSLVTHALASRTVALPPLMTALPSIQTLVAEAGYKRLQATVGTIPAAYNGAVMFQYLGEGGSLSITASIGYAGSSGVVLAMPELSRVEGWQNAFAVPGTASGTWSVSVEGGNGINPLCTENRITILARRSGSF